MRPISTNFMHSTRVYFGEHMPRTRMRGRVRSPYASITPSQVCGRTGSAAQTPPQAEGATKRTDLGTAYLDGYIVPSAFGQARISRMP